MMFLKYHVILGFLTIKIRGSATLIILQGRIQGV